MDEGSPECFQDLRRELTASEAKENRRPLPFPEAKEQVLAVQEALREALFDDSTGEEDPIWGVAVIGSYGRAMLELEKLEKTGSQSESDLGIHQGSDLDFILAMEGDLGTEFNKQKARELMERFKARLEQAGCQDGRSLEEPRTNYRNL